MAIETYFDGTTTVYLGQGNVGIVPAKNEHDKAISVKFFNNPKKKKIGKSFMTQEEYDSTFFPVTLQFSSPEDVSQLIDLLKAAKAKFKG